MRISSKGDLRLDSAEGLEAGGRDGPVLVAGNPARSEIMRRITLPPFDEDAMPPDGEPPLDVGETELIRWWIEHGASLDARYADLDDRPPSVETYIRRVAAPRTPRRTGIFALDVPQPDSTAIANLQNRGLLVSRVDPAAPFLYVTAANVREEFGDEDVDLLLPLAAQIARLDVSSTNVTSRIKSALASMPHLTHLYIERTEIDGSILTTLTGHEHLEYLNLYGTRIADSDLEALKEMTSLNAVYLWETNVTPEAAAALRRARPGLHVNVGMSLEPSDSTKIAGAAGAVGLTQ